jgi:aminoglycoside 2'-N-acetyltransferase I
MIKAIDLQIVSKIFAELTVDEKRQFEELDRIAFPEVEESESFEDNTSDSPGFLFFGKVNGIIISKVSLIKRIVQVGNEDVTIGGIGGVATHPDYRQRGFAGILVEKAGSYLKSHLEYEFGLLFCDPKKIPYYGQFGYKVVDNPLYIRLNGKRLLFEDTKMVLSLRSKPWLDGDVDVNGPSW